LDNIGSVVRVPTTPLIICNPVSSLSLLTISFILPPGIHHAQLEAKQNQVWILKALLCLPLALLIFFIYIFLFFVLYPVDSVNKFLAPQQG
jgi:hypothetical protein